MNFYLTTGGQVWIMKFVLYFLRIIWTELKWDFRVNKFNQWVTDEHMFKLNPLNSFNSQNFAKVRSKWTVMGPRVRAGCRNELFWDQKVGGKIGENCPVTGTITGRSIDLPVTVHSPPVWPPTLKHNLLEDFRITRLNLGKVSPGWPMKLTLN